MYSWLNYIPKSVLLGNTFLEIVVEEISNAPLLKITNWLMIQVLLTELSHKQCVTVTRKVPHVVLGSQGSHGFGP